MVRNNYCSTTNSSLSSNRPQLLTTAGGSRREPGWEQTDNVAVAWDEVIVSKARKYLRLEEFVQCHHATIAGALIEVQVVRFIRCNEGEHREIKLINGI